MIPFAVQVIATLLSRLFTDWRSAVRIGMSLMFLFTGGSHFTRLKHDLAAMIPPPLTGQLWIIYVTGALLIAGAIGLLVPRLRRAAAWGLAAMLVGLFPANVYASMTGASIGGNPATAMWLRAPLQLLWLYLMVREARLPEPQPPARIARMDLV